MIDAESKFVSVHSPTFWETIKSGTDTCLALHTYWFTFSAMQEGITREVRSLAPVFYWEDATGSSSMHPIGEEDRHPTGKGEQSLEQG